MTQPKDVVVRYVEAARDGMSAVITGSFAEDATWEYPGDLPLSGTYRGVEAIVQTFLGGAAALMAPDSAVTITLTNVIADGDQVAAEWTSGAISHTGAAYHNRNVGIFTVKDGKITSVREYTDTLHAAQAFFPELFQALPETQNERWCSRH
jgi:ketosteroid isomerase-like protein